MYVVVISWSSFYFALENIIYIDIVKMSQDMLPKYLKNVSEKLLCAEVLPVIDGKMLSLIFVFIFCIFFVFIFFLQSLADTINI